MYKFDSGPRMVRPRIGFNVNDVDYFFFQNYFEESFRFARALEPPGVAAGG